MSQVLGHFLLGSVELQAPVALVGDDLVRCRLLGYLTVDLFVVLQPVLREGATALAAVLFPEDPLEGLVLIFITPAQELGVRDAEGDAVRKFQLEPNVPR